MTQLDGYAARVARLAGGELHRSIAKKIAGKLVCSRCGHVQPCSPASVEVYLQSGWPTHCGVTMTLEQRHD